MRPLNLHRWDVTPKEAVKLQAALKEAVALKNDFDVIRVVAGADVAVEKEAKRAYAGLIAYSLPDLREISRQGAVGKVTFPYVPGLLAFREGPILSRALEELSAEPDLLIFDGQGIAHPRGLGIATHMGILFDKPSIGCAKSVLVGTFAEPGTEVGDYSPLVYQGRTVGAALRTRRNVKPVFVSPGHKIDLETSVEIILKCVDGFRVPKPTREAHYFVEALKKAPKPD
jgi:deoxyribonuclease V